MRLIVEILYTLNTTLYGFKIPVQYTSTYIYVYGPLYVSMKRDLSWFSSLYKKGRHYFHLQYSIYNTKNLYIYLYDDSHHPHSYMEFRFSSSPFIYKLSVYYFLIVMLSIQYIHHYYYNMSQCVYFSLCTQHIHIYLCCSKIHITFPLYNIMDETYVASRWVGCSATY